ALLGKGVVGFRARGLWAGVDIDPTAGTGREIGERLLREGVLVKDTHGSTIRLAPPLTITAEELTGALGALEKVLA
ncbi:aminotransferase class III-fold pyridoxal phosphate-dependent enzyme, partial [Streptomyces sp. T21Q-yed]